MVVPDAPSVAWCPGKMTLLTILVSERFLRYIGKEERAL
jgi:hypothetical protein